MPKDKNYLLGRRTPEAWDLIIRITTKRNNFRRWLASMVWWKFVDSSGKNWDSFRATWVDSYRPSDAKARPREIKRALILMGFKEIVAEKMSHG